MRREFTFAVAAIPAGDLEWNNNRVAHFDVSDLVPNGGHLSHAFVTIGKRSLKGPRSEIFKQSGVRHMCKDRRAHFEGHVALNKGTVQAATSDGKWADIVNSRSPPILIWLSQFEISNCELNHRQFDIRACLSFDRDIGFGHDRPILRR